LFIVGKLKIVHISINCQKKIYMVDYKKRKELDLKIKKK
jgi:hypothetical protein